MYYLTTMLFVGYYQWELECLGRPKPIIIDKTLYDAK